jgi:IclR family acetate operon transcriptional repressor
MGMTADDAGMDTPTEHLVAVRRTMLVLEMLADAGAGMSLSDIAKELKVNKSIASRIVLTLSDMNYIYRNSENRRFYVGFKICNVGFRILGRAGLADQCEPVLSRLAEQTGELVLFAVLDSGTPRWVMAVTGPRRQLQVVPMTPIEPHSTATGKAWLATLPDEVIAHVLKGRMRALTPYTITDLDQMMRQIHEIRTTGFAFSNQENEVGIAAVATAIRREEAGKSVCVGFVSITAPLYRTTPQDFIRYRDLLQDAARVLGDAWPLSIAAGFSKDVNNATRYVTVATNWTSPKNAGRRRGAATTIPETPDPAQKQVHVHGYEAGQYRA